MKVLFSKVWTSQGTKPRVARQLVTITGGSSEEEAVFPAVRSHGDGVLYPQKASALWAYVRVGSRGADTSQYSLLALYQQFCLWLNPAASQRAWVPRTLEHSAQGHSWVWGGLFFKSNDRGA